MIWTKEWHNPPRENQEILDLTVEINALKEQYNKSLNSHTKSKDTWKKVAPKEGEQQKNFPLVHSPQGMGNSLTQWV